MAGATSMIGSGRPGAVRVTAQGPFAVGFVAWRDGLGKLVCTVVAKATYALAPGEAAPLDAPLPLQEEDRHWDDDPSKSLRVPSDLAPFKSAAEVVVVGSAFAPADRPARSVTARVVIGSVDKSVEVWVPRGFRSDGAVHESPPQPRFPLRYEHAAGGPSTDNPAGVDVGRADKRGRLPIPQIVPLGCDLGAPGGHIPIAGFGPIAAGWPQRAGRLGPHDRAWLHRPAASPLPQAFPPRFFQAAPMDQWLDRALAPNERLVLESLDAAHPWLVTSLSGLEPRAIVAGASLDPFAMVADLLVVDTDRGLATLTYRAPIAVADDATSLRVIVVGARMGAELGHDAVRRIVESEGRVDTSPTFGTAPGPAPTTDSSLSTRSAPPAWIARRPALPFSALPPPVPPPRPSSPHVALPFRAGFDDALPPTPASLPAPAPIPAPALVSEPPKLGLGMDLGHALSPEYPPVPGLVRASSLPPPPAVVESPPPLAKPGAALEPPPRPPRAPSSFDLAFGGGKAPAKPRDAGSGGAGFDAAFGGVKAASDAAADHERARDPAPAEAARAADQPPRRLAVVDLLSFDEKIAARLRSMKRFAGLWAQAPRPRSSHGVDDPRAPASPERARADVLRVLSCGRAAEAGEIRRALAESLDDLTDLEPPILLVAGELRPTFDETETLRATVSVAQPVAGGDKKLLAAIAIAQEALTAPLGPRPDAALGLSRQIEQASGALSLPARYVASEVDRLLLDGRKYRRRTLLGAGRVRADLALPSGGEPLLVYLPDTVVTSLPMLLSYPVVALCEVRPREDMLEAQGEALFAAAIGRVLHSRGDG